jgi:hypothetical protein
VTILTVTVRPAVQKYVIAFESEGQVSTVLNLYYKMQVSLLIMKYRFSSVAFIIQNPEGINVICRISVLRTANSFASLSVKF